MIESWLLLTLYAALGTGHCFAMCGGFAVLATQSAQTPTGFWYRLLLYVAGKALTYWFLVLVLAWFTGWADEWVFDGTLAPALSWTAGLAMIGFGVWQGFRFVQARRSGQPFRQPGEDGCRVNGKLRIMRHPGAAFMLGWANGFLPCGFLWIALAYLSQWSSPTAQLGGVLLFSVATTPGLLAAAGAFRWLGRRWVRYSLPISSVALLLFGGLLLLRATDQLPHEWLHVLTPVSLAQEPVCDLGCCGVD